MGYSTQDISFVYDANNNLTSYLIQTWNGSTWVTAYQLTITYDSNNNQTCRLTQQWNGSVWVNISQYIATYDANNNWTSWSTQHWNGSAWINNFYQSMTYDANKFRVSDLFKFYNSTGTAITGGDSAHYYFHTAVGISAPAAVEGGINIYPNPTSGQLTIENGQMTIKSVEIYDMMGERCLTTLTHPQPPLTGALAFAQRGLSVDVSSLAPGIYFVRIKDARDNITARKFVKE